MEMNFETARVKTFHRCNIPYFVVNKLAMIRFYLKEAEDKVKCHFCDLEIGLCQPIDDDPVFVHLKYSQDCRLMHGNITDNIALNPRSIKK